MCVCTSVCVYWHRAAQADGPGHVQSVCGDVSWHVSREGEVHEGNTQPTQFLRSHPKHWDGKSLSWVNYVNQIESVLNHVSSSKCIFVLVNKKWLMKKKKHSGGNFLPSQLSPHLFLARWIIQLPLRSTAAHQLTRRSPCPTSCAPSLYSAWLWTTWWPRSWTRATTITGTGMTLSGTGPAASGRYGHASDQLLPSSQGRNYVTNVNLRILCVVFSHSNRSPFHLRRTSPSSGCAARRRCPW